MSYDFTQDDRFLSESTWTPTAKDSLKTNFDRLFRHGEAGDYNLVDYYDESNPPSDFGPVLQAAVDDIGTKGGGVLRIPAGTYDFSTGVQVREALQIVGVGYVEGPGPSVGNDVDGTWLRMRSGMSDPLIRFENMASPSVRGAVVRSLAIVQEQPGPGPGWSPENYEFVFRVMDVLGAVDFHDIFLCRVNKGIFVSNSGRTSISDLKGQVFRVGVQMETSLDVARIARVHFWTFWTSDLSIVRDFQQQNLDCIVLGRCDGIFIDDIFALGCRSVLRLANSISQPTSKMYAGSIYADFAAIGIWVEQDLANGSIESITTQGELWGGAGASIPNATGLKIDGSNVDLQFGNLRIDAVDQSSVILAGSGIRLFVQTFRAEIWNRDNNGAPVFAFNNTSGFNQVSLSSFPVLGNGGNGGLSNAAASQGYVATTTPISFSEARPGLTVGYPDTGFFNPSPNALGASAGGHRSLLMDPSGHVELGYAGGQSVAALAPLQLPSYPADDLPSAATYPRCLIYVVQNGSEIIALSNGAIWLNASGQPL